MAAYARLSDRPLVILRHTDRHEPPACNVPTDAGWCVLLEGHRDTHVALPPTYSPEVTQ